MPLKTKSRGEKKNKKIKNKNPEPCAIRKAPIVGFYLGGFCEAAAMRRPAWLNAVLPAELLSSSAWVPPSRAAPCFGGVNPQRCARLGLPAGGEDAATSSPRARVGADARLGAEPAAAGGAPVSPGPGPSPAARPQPGLSDAGLRALRCRRAGSHGGRYREEGSRSHPHPHPRPHPRPHPHPRL